MRVNFLDNVVGPLAGASLLKEKVALVTGAGLGIGRACARLFASQGAAVVALDIQKTALNGVCSEISADGGSVHGIEADVTDGAQLDRAFEAVLDVFGRLDILVNNAGGGQPTDLFSIDETEWNRVLSLNLSAVFMASQRAARIFRDRKSGCIINMSSQAGRSVR